MSNCVQDPESLAKKIQTLADEVLFDEGEDSTSLPPEAEQHFLLAVAALHTAYSHMMLAHYAEMKAR